MVGYNRNMRRDSKFFVKNSHKRFSKVHFFFFASLDEESLMESLFLI